MIVALLLLLAGIAGLFVGAEFLVRGAASLSQRFGVSPLIIGVIVLAYGTSMPELAVSVEAAMRGAADIAVGNIVGSNVCTIGVVLGLAVLVRPMKVESDMLKWHVPLMIGSIILLSFFLWDASLTRLEGGILFASIVVYTLLNVWEVKRNRKRQAECLEELPPPSPRSKVWLDVILVLGGLGLLAVGGHVLIDGATDLAQRLGMSEAIIALTIVAVGTSCPDIMASTVAALKGHADMAVGNAIGSVTFNSLNALGLAALAKPMAGFEVQIFDIGAMLFLAAMTFPLMRSGFTLKRWEGGVLIGIYLLYVIIRCTSI